MFLTNSMPPPLYNDYEKGDEMYYELYVDSLFLVNFVMNLYLLLLVDRSLFRTATRKRLVLGAAVGALLYFLPFFCRGPVWLKLALGIPPGSIAMIFTAFRIRSFHAFWKILGRLLTCSVFMGGVMLLLIRNLPWLQNRLGGMWGVMGLGAVLYLLFGYLNDRRCERNSLCRATLIQKGNRMTVTALVDSGNSLVEPVSGKPVSIIEKSIVSGLWEEEPKFYRAIPYHSIGKKRGILKGYLLPELQIEIDGVVKSCKEIYVAVCEEYIAAEENDNGGNVKMILNPLLLEEQNKSDAS